MRYDLKGVPPLRHQNKPARIIRQRLPRCQKAMPPDDERQVVRVFLPAPYPPAFAGSAGLGVPLVGFSAEVLDGHGGRTRD